MYNITGGNDLGWFQIEPLSGLITTKSAMDREVQATVTLTVTVSDAGIQPKFSTAKAVIRLTDVNDNAPVFEKSSYEVSVSENASVNATFVSVVARDADDGDNSVVVYSLDNFSDVFRIDSRSGDISPVVSLDRENVDSYVLVSLLKMEKLNRFILRLCTCAFVLY
jgi:hypothetical protein